jgi:hypothetical protein
MALCMALSKFIERKEGVFPPAIGGTTWRVAVDACYSELHYVYVPTNVPAVTTLPVEWQWQQQVGWSARRARLGCGVEAGAGAGAGRRQQPIVFSPPVMMSVLLKQVTVTAAPGHVHTNDKQISLLLCWVTVWWLVQFWGIFGRSKVGIFSPKVCFFSLYRQYLQEYVDTALHSYSQMFYIT